MRRLANRIETELKEQEICAVYNSELARVWPTTISPEKRKKEINALLKNIGWPLPFTMSDCAPFSRRRSEHRENGN